jgi:hypothetical protein
MRRGQIIGLHRLIKDSLSEQAQQKFLTVFNQYVDKGCDDGSAFQLAWKSIRLESELAQATIDR